MNEILRNLAQDELRYDDIVVINPDPLTTRKECGPIRAALSSAGIKSHLAGVDVRPDVFFLEEASSITFTGVFRAKGNEAGMVYVINAQDCEGSGLNLARLRNQLFTAMTRSKAWVRVLGVGERMQRLMSEYEQVKQRGFRLDFRYPTEEEREYISIVHRDVSEDEKSDIQQAAGDLASVLERLERGDLHLADLPPELIARMKGLIGGQ